MSKPKKDKALEIFNEIYSVKKPMTTKPKDTKRVDIVGYEGSYQVSNIGEVKSLNRMVGGKHGIKRLIKGRVLKQSTTYGYQHVGLSKKGKLKTLRVHRLVATAFLPPSEYDCMNHKDSNRKNNHVFNLEWCTKKQNAQHALKNGRLTKMFKSGEKHPLHKLKEKEVLDILKKVYHKKHNYGSFARIAREYNVTQGCIYALLNGISWNKQRWFIEQKMEEK